MSWLNISVRNKDDVSTRHWSNTGSGKSQSEKEKLINFFSANKHPYLLIFVWNKPFHQFDRKTMNLFLAILHIYIY